MVTIHSTLFKSIVAFTPQFQSHNEQNPVATHVFDTSDWYETNLYTSPDTCELYDIVFDKEPLFKDNDDISITFYIKLHKVVDLGEFHQSSCSTSDSENVY